MPDPCHEILPGVAWGHFDDYFTPAYWKVRCEEERSLLEGRRFRLTDSLMREAAFCLLGGHGIPAEVGVAAYQRLVDEGLLEGTRRPASDYQDALSRPIAFGSRSIRYRFASQKARYLSALSEAFYLEEAPSPHDPISFRDWFLRLPGFGLKTASWVTRNWLGSAEVAILDIHICRAGVIMGLFDVDHEVGRDYRQLEASFLEFSRCLGVSASLLDAVIWKDMKDAGGFALRRYHSKMGIRVVDEQALLPGVLAA